jgi:hypothetical protein
MGARLFDSHFKICHEDRLANGLKEQGTSFLPHLISHSEAAEAEIGLDAVELRFSRK